MSRRYKNSFLLMYLRCTSNSMNSNECGLILGKEKAEASTIFIIELQLNSFEFYTGHSHSVSLKSRMSANERR